MRFARRSKSRNRSMWYFAYGSNMNRQQTENRVQRTGLRWMVGCLDGYTLRFNKKSTLDHSGKANIVRDEQGAVWGVVFEVHEEELERLGAFEGGYKKKKVRVTIPGGPTKLSAEAFMADAGNPDRLPTFSYLQNILEGACQHGLPMEYCNILARIKARE